MEYPSAEYSKIVALSVKINVLKKQGFGVSSSDKKSGDRNNKMDKIDQNSKHKDTLLILTPFLVHKQIMNINCSWKIQSDSMFLKETIIFL